MTEEQDFLKAHLNEEINLELANSLKAGSRMLVDSDGLAFIYILENDTAFYYVTFEQSTWPYLKKLLVTNKSLILDLGNEKSIELTSMFEELTFLTENIDGNSNYGEVMEKAVKEVFN